MAHKVVYLEFTEHAIRAKYAFWKPEMESLLAALRKFWVACTIKDISKSLGMVRQEKEEIEQHLEKAGKGYLGKRLQTHQMCPLPLKVEEREQV